MRRRHLGIIIVIIIAVAIVGGATFAYTSVEPKPKTEEEYLNEVVDILVAAIELRGDFKYMLEEEPQFILFTNPNVSASFKATCASLLERYNGLTPPNDNYTDLHRYVGEYLTLNLKGFEEWERSVTEENINLITNSLSYFSQADERRDLIKTELSKFRKDI